MIPVLRVTFRLLWQERRPCWKLPWADDVGSRDVVALVAFDCKCARNVHARPRYTIPPRRLECVDATPVTIERLALPGWRVARSRTERVSMPVWSGFWDAPDTARTSNWLWCYRWRRRRVALLWRRQTPYVSWRRLERLGRVTYIEALKVVVRRVLWRLGVLSYGHMYHDVGDQDVTYDVYVTGNRANVEPMLRVTRGW